MAYTFNATAGNYSSSTVSYLDATTPISSVAAGDLIIVMMRTRYGTTHDAVTDTAGNSYTQVEHIDDVTATNRSMSMWYAIAAGSASNVVVRVDTTGGTGQDDRFGLQWVHYSGISAYQASNVGLQTAPGTGTDAVTVSDTATAQPALVFAFCWHNSGTETVAAGTGFNDRGAGSMTEQFTRIEDKQITATGSTAATFTASVDNRHISFVAIFSESAPATTKKLKLLAHSSAASATGVAGVVFEDPTGGDITGAKIGEFTGAAFEASLESGQAVLKVDVADFGGEALTTSDTPVVLVRNGTYSTGVVDGTVIEE